MNQSKKSKEKHNKSNKSIVVQDQDKITDLMAKLNLKSKVNPKEWPLDAKKVKNSKYFVIKSFTEDDVHRAVKYKVWCSTFHGNKRLQNAWEKEERFKNQGKPFGDIFLFFSVNGSGYFCGVARMKSKVIYDSEKTQNLWHVDQKNEGGQNSKWRGYFDIEWLYIKDVPNRQFSKIKNPWNYHRPVFHSRDCQDMPSNEGESIIKVFHNYKHDTSLFEDFEYYEKLEKLQRIQMNDSAFQLKSKENEVNEMIQNMEKEQQIEEHILKIENRIEKVIRKNPAPSDSETFLRKLQMGKPVDWSNKSSDQQRESYDFDFPTFKIETPNIDSNTRDTAYHTSSFDYEKENINVTHSFPSVRDYLRPSCHDYLFTERNDGNDNKINQPKRRPNALPIRNPDGSKFL